jgi:hypothetical protein
MSSAKFHSSALIAVLASSQALYVIACTTRRNRCAPGVLRIIVADGECDTVLTLTSQLSKFFSVTRISPRTPASCRSNSV